MHEPHKEQPVNLERALIQAYRGQQPPTLSAEWVSKVMADVRRQRMTQRFQPDAAALIWQAAAMLALTLSLLLASAMTWHFHVRDAEQSFVVADEFDEPSWASDTP
jgi:polyferredoxin